MNSNDNFDALWARLKESISERREPEAVYTWEFISADEMSEEDARLAHDMSLLSDADEAMLKSKYDLTEIN